MGAGGMRWGAGRPAHKGKAEACMRLDVRLWARRGMLAPGYSGTWSWSNSHTGERTGSIGFRISGAMAILSYALNGSTRSQTVPIVTTPCNFGSSRPWFACPLCHERVAILYLRRGGFYCRTCAKVGYYSQSEDACGRAWRKQQKAEAKLDPNWQRPKGMHHATRERLLETIWECEEVRDRAIAGFLSRLGFKL